MNDKLKSKLYVTSSEEVVTPLGYDKNQAMLDFKDDGTFNLKLIEIDLKTLATKTSASWVGREHR